VPPGLLDDLANSGFSLDRTKVLREWVEDRITTFWFGGVRIDWMAPVLPIFSRAISEATLVPGTEGCEIRVAEPVGLVLMTLFAFSPQDQLDIETLLAANRGNLDVDPIRRAWSGKSDGEDERTKWLEAAVARSICG
jgi:hypothetical protein